MSKLKKVKVSSDVEVIGTVSVGADPKTDMNVATKKYVDDHSFNATTYTVTVPASGWTSNGYNMYDTRHYYSQSITVDGITSTDEPIVLVVPGNDKSSNTAILTAYECVSRITTGNNSITLYADYNKPASDFTILLKVV